MSEAKGSEKTELSNAHYKAAANDELLSAVDASLRQMPYRHVFAPECWKKMTAVELEQKPGVCLVTKLCTIVLMSSMFNTNNNKMGREAMKHAELLGLLPPDQSSSRKDHRSNEQALNKCLALDLLRQKRQAGAICCNDAKSCYDRIVHSIAILSMRRVGILLAPLVSMFKVLQEANYKIRTAYGDSTKTCVSPQLILFQGVGQGNGAGPAIWVAISAAIIQMLYTAGFGLTLHSALSGTLVAIACFAFVDDTDVIHSRYDVNTPGKVIAAEMQAVVDLWEGGIRATGGALEPSKSYWYLIDFKWIPDKLRWDYKRKAEVKGEIYVQNPQGERELLERLEVDEPRVTLGINFSPDGSWRGQVKHLSEKVNKWVSHLKSGHLNQADTWYALTRTIMKTMEYPMVAISLTRDQWDEVMKPLLQAVLPRIGITRSFPRLVVYAPLSRKGLGLIHPHDNQYLKQLQTVMRHGD
jgi:hypothetical protein